jgi:hypothetical protein
MTLPTFKPRQLAAGVLLVWVAGVSVGCGHPMQRKLEGRWLGDAVENFDDADVAAATGWAKGLSMEFSGSTITVAIAAEEPRSGKYEVARVHKNDVHLAVKRKEGTVDRVRFKFDDERTLRWMVGERHAVVMRHE